MKFKIGQCHLALKEWRAALAELETIPARGRSTPPLHSFCFFFYFTRLSPETEFILYIHAPHARGVFVALTGSDIRECRRNEGRRGLMECGESLLRTNPGYRRGPGLYP